MTVSPNSGALSLPDLLERSLREAAESGGAAVAPVSLTVEYVNPDAAVAAGSAWITRATRSLIFAAGALTSTDGAVAAAGNAVYRVVRPGP